MRPTPNVVMFATTCSKPEVMNASRHQKIVMRRATSVCSRLADHMARQTSMLHRTPRQKSSTLLSPPLASSIPASIAPAGVVRSSSPVRWSIAANANAPRRLPAKQKRIVRPASSHVMVRRQAPCVVVIIVEVTSSPPAV